MEYAVQIIVNNNIYTKLLSRNVRSDRQFLVWKFCCDFYYVKCILFEIDQVSTCEVDSRSHTLSFTYSERKTPEFENRSKKSDETTAKVNVFFDAQHRSIHRAMRICIDDVQSAAVGVLDDKSIWRAARMKDATRAAYDAGTRSMWRDTSCVESFVSCESLAAALQSTSLQGCVSASTSVCPSVRPFGADVVSVPSTTACSLLSHLHPPRRRRRRRRLLWSLTHST